MNDKNKVTLSVRTLMLPFCFYIYRHCLIIIGLWGFVPDQALVHKNSMLYVINYNYRCCNTYSETITRRNHLRREEVLVASHRSDFFDILSKIVIFPEISSTSSTWVNVTLIFLWVVVFSLFRMVYVLCLIFYIMWNI